jgi:hypothetical protein
VNAWFPPLFFRLLLFDDSCFKTLQPRHLSCRKWTSSSFQTFRCRLDRICSIYTTWKMFKWGYLSHRVPSVSAIMDNNGNRVDPACVFKELKFTDRLNQELKARGIHSTKLPIHSLASLLYATTAEMCQSLSDISHQLVPWLQVKQSWFLHCIALAPDQPPRIHKQGVISCSALLWLGNGTFWTYYNVWSLEWIIQIKVCLYPTPPSFQNF